MSTTKQDYEPVAVAVADKGVHFHVAGLELDRAVELDRAEHALRGRTSVDIEGRRPRQDRRVNVSLDPELGSVEVSPRSDLPEDAVANGRTFSGSVPVPAGGVSRGQAFNAPFVPGGGGLSWKVSTVPEGRWKDGLCDCFKFGCLHPALWMAV